MKLSHVPNGPTLEEISIILVHPQNVQIDRCRKQTLYTTPVSQITPIYETTPCMFWRTHRVRNMSARLSLKLHGQNGSVLEEISGIMMHPQNVPNPSPITLTLTPNRSQNGPNLAINYINAATPRLYRTRNFLNCGRRFRSANRATQVLSRKHA